MEEDAPKTYVKTYDWLKPHQFKEGGPGGPGRPKGPTLKTWLKNHFEEMTDEERIAFLNKIDPIKAWEMGEGKAQAQMDHTTKGDKIVILPAPVTNRLDGDTPGTTSETD
jgi:hypothetical protein